MVLKAEAVEQLVLCLRSLSHHLEEPPDVTVNIGDDRRSARGVFQKNRCIAVAQAGDAKACR